LLIVSDRSLTIDATTYRAGLPFNTEDWRGNELILAGVARHAREPRILYETPSREQDEARIREQGVTCICITRNRRDWLPKAIRCYQSQTHSPRELLIVSDGQDIKDLIPDDETIRHIEIEQGFTIGEKRNYAVQRAKGQNIAHWDDDDYSAPARLALQSESLRQSGKAFTGYSSMLFTDGESWWKFDGGAGYAIGTSFFYRRQWAINHPFMSVQIGEDGEFLKVARDHRQVATEDGGLLMYATIHKDNTSPRNLARHEWEALPNQKPF
jgi:hypothetical protein